MTPQKLGGRWGERKKSISGCIREQTNSDREKKEKKKETQAKLSSGSQDQLDYLGGWGGRNKLNRRNLTRRGDSRNKM